jgi:hypothetical protein
MMKAGGAHASRVEGVPLIAAGAEPLVLLAGRPTAERAPNAWAEWIVALVLIWSAIYYDARFGGVV